MYVFGGYGGIGFARRDFNDITVLDLDTYEWRPIECTGEVPEPRSGHQGMAVKENLFVIGGWNSMVRNLSQSIDTIFSKSYISQLQFDNMYILDTATNVWSKPQQNNSFGPPRWNFAAVSVFAGEYYFAVRD
jgi:dynein heavy chain